MRSFISGNMVRIFGILSLQCASKKLYSKTVKKRLTYSPCYRKEILTERKAEGYELSSKARNHFSVKKGCIIFVYIVEVQTIL